MKNKEANSRKGKFWSKEEDDMLLGFPRVEQKILKKLSHKFNRSVGSIRDRCNYLGIKFVGRNKKWTQVDLDYLRGSYKTKTYMEISEYLDRPEGSVSAKALSMGLLKDSAKRYKNSSNKRWTKEEDDVLRDFYEKGEWTGKLNRSNSAKQNRRSYLGIEMSQFAKNKLGMRASEKRSLNVFPNYGKLLGTSIRHYYNGAKIRGISTDLLDGAIESMEYLDKIAYDVCSLSGIKLNYPRRAKDQTATASLDRIDSNKGYIRGNVQWIHKDINRMKMKMNEDYFIELCNQITDHARKN